MKILLTVVVLLLAGCAPIPPGYGCGTPGGGAFGLMCDESKD